MRKKLFVNMSASVLYQLTAIICGFIVPRLILQNYGSEVNGLVSAITQYLTIIAFLEFGVGAVVQSALYHPLAQKDYEKVSQIMYSGNHFFRKIALILVVYVIALIGLSPYLINGNFGWLYTGLLIFSISISYFAQYYFGIMDGLLLQADQRGYIIYITQIITLVINTIVCIIEIRMGFSIQTVKLTTSIIFLSRPLIQRIYIRRYYAINRHPQIEEEPIKQKWNGLAQHIAAIILDDTDTIVLSIFSTLSNVSIYSVYYLVIKGVKTLFLSCSTSIQAVLGERIAKGEREKIKIFFGSVEFALHTVITVIFTCVALLIVPFVRVYTSGVNDVNYEQPLFAFLLVLAHASHCLRTPYNIAILAAGHFKQTQKNYIVASVLNIVISVLTVYKFGLIGVAIGTLVAMVYQTIWMAVYDSRHIIYWPIRNFAKQLLVDCIVVVGAYLSTRWIHLAEVSYFAWIIMACKIVCVVLVVSVCVNCLLYRGKLLNLCRAVKVRVL